MRRIVSLASLVLLYTAFPGRMASAHVPIAPCSSGWVVDPVENRAGWSNALQATWSFSSSDAWAVGVSVKRGPIATLAEHWDGVQWSIVPTEDARHGSMLLAVSGTSPSDVWAVGRREHGLDPTTTLVEHWDGVGWSIIPSPNADRKHGAYNILTGVAAISPADAWAVGGQSTTNRPVLIHWDGSAWKLVRTRLHGGLTAISAVATDDVWAVGFRSTDANTGRVLVAHFDGSAWTSVRARNVRDAVVSSFTGVEANSADDVWVVGYSYSIVTGTFDTLAEHFDGVGWHIVPSVNPSPSSNFLSAVTASSPTDATAAGEAVSSATASAVVEQGSTSGIDLASIPEPDVDNYLYGATSSGSDRWVVGYSDHGSSPNVPLILHTC